jgi:hypothetical protein
MTRKFRPVRYLSFSDSGRSVPTHEKDVVVRDGLAPGAAKVVQVSRGPLKAPMVLVKDGTR